MTRDIDDEAVEAAEVQSWTGVIGRVNSVHPYPLTVRAPIWSPGLALSRVDQADGCAAVIMATGWWVIRIRRRSRQARTFTCGPALAKMVQGASWEEAGLPECFEVTAERLAKARQ